MKKLTLKGLRSGMLQCLVLLFALTALPQKANSQEQDRNALMMRGLTYPMVDMFIPLSGNMFDFEPNQINSTDVGAFFMILMEGMRYWLEATIPPMETKLIGATALPLTASQMRRMMRQQEVQIVDIRSPEEFNGAHIPGSINVPLYEYDEFIKSGRLKDDQPEILICA